MAGEPMTGEETPERYFLKYAYPCSFTLVDLGELSDAKQKELEKKLLNNEPVDKKELENIFRAGVKRLKKIAHAKGKTAWDMEVIKDYFFGKEHNDFIDKQDGMYAKTGQAIRELCKVHKAEVTEKRDNILTVRYNKISRNVFATLVPDVKPGDRVTVHWAFAIEKID